MVKVTQLTSSEARFQTQVVTLRDQLNTIMPVGPWAVGGVVHLAPNLYICFSLYINRSSTDLFHLLLLTDWPPKSEPQHMLPHLAPPPFEELTIIAIPILQMRKLKRREEKSLSPKTQSQEVAECTSEPPHHISPCLQDRTHAPHSPAQMLIIHVYALLMPMPPAESADC